MDFDRPGFDREVGLRLQLMRKRRGMTQATLSEKIGLPRASYANIEAGRQRIPVDVVWRAAVVLSVPISSLVPEPVTRPSATEPLFQPVESRYETYGASVPNGPQAVYVGSSTYPIAHLVAPPPIIEEHKQPTIRIVKDSK